MEYQLMYKDEIVAEFNQTAMTAQHEYVVIKKTRLPIGMQNGMTLKNWLKQRRADKSRVSVRKLLATLKMNFQEGEYVSQFRKPTDFWWVRKTGSNDIFNSQIEDLHLLALGLEAVVFKNPKNYEVANIGSYDKGWKAGRLVKSGNKNELFSEMLYAKISKKYLPTAKYQLEQINNKTFITTPNFLNIATDGYLVLADEWTGTGVEEVFEDWFIKFQKMLTPEEITGLKIMHFLDVVLNNFDRHCQNFGFIYFEAKPRILAPNFDFNLAIIGYNGLENLGANEINVKTYFDLFSDIPELVKAVPNNEWLAKEIALISKDLGLCSQQYLIVASWIINRWERLIGGFSEDT